MRILTTHTLLCCFLHCISIAVEIDNTMNITIEILSYFIIF
jgi:hypothetical protein